MRRPGSQEVFRPDFGLRARMGLARAVNATLRAGVEMERLEARLQA
jgi:hypothetical protein